MSIAALSKCAPIRLRVGIMFRVLIGTGALRLWVTLAFFGIFALQNQAKAQDPVLDNTWTGFSVSGGIGGSIAINETSLEGSRNGEIGLCNPFNCGPSFFPLVGLTQSADFDDDSNDTSFLATAQIAYDHQIGRDRNFVIGAFADIDFTTGDGTEFNALSEPVTTITGTADIEQDFSFSVGGRIGVLASARMLIYGLAAYTQVELDESQFRFTVNDPLGFITPINSPTDLTVNLPDSLSGFTLGAGVERKINDALSFKFEYRYSNLEAESESASNTVIQCCLAIVARRIQEDVEASLDAELHSIRASLSWKPRFMNARR